MREVIGKGIRMLCLPVALAVAGSFALAQPPGTQSERPDRDAKTDVRLSQKERPQAPADHYIVALEDSVGGDLEKRSALLSEVEILGGTVYRQYSSVLNGGFAATLSAKAVEALRRSPHVAFVEPDGVIAIAPEQTSIVDAQDAAGATEHGICSCGLDRINQRHLPLDGDCSIDGNAWGVTVWVMGTGIRTTHTVFEGRAQQVVNYAGGANEDCNGLGTHAAGIIHSVALDAQLRGVKVLNCPGRGSLSGVIAGVNYIIANGYGNDVVYAQFGGGESTSLDTAFENLVNAGFIVAVPAGNSDADACNYSPGRAPSVYSVAATECHTDCRTTWSNWGSCVDIFAPGGDITSAWNTSDTATRTLSGTYAAAALVAGGAAVDRWFIHNATQNVVCNANGSPNLLLYVD